jgi:hypothetical protein
VRQAGCAIATLEDHRLAQGRQGAHRLGDLAGARQGRGEVTLLIGQAQAEDAVEQQARLFERPALRLAGLVGETLQHGGAGSLPRPLAQGPILTGRRKAGLC